MFIPLSCVKTIWRCWRVFLKNDTPRKKRQFLIGMGNRVWCCNYILYNLLNFNKNKRTKTLVLFLSYFLL